MLSKPQAWTEPVSREGEKSSPKYSCNLCADQVFVIRNRIPSGFSFGSLVSLGANTIPRARLWHNYSLQPAGQKVQGSQPPWSPWREGPCRKGALWKSLPMHLVWGVEARPPPWPSARPLQQKSLSQSLSESYHRWQWVSPLQNKTKNKTKPSFSPMGKLCLCWDSVTDTVVEETVISNKLVRGFWQDPFFLVLLNVVNIFKDGNVLGPTAFEEWRSSGLDNSGVFSPFLSFV